MTRSILVVDDDPEILSALSKGLQKAGFKVTSVDTGNKATAAFIEKYYDEPYELIVLDVQLPDISGIEVLKIIRQEEELRGIKYDDGVKILIQTGHQEAWMDSFNRGCDDFLVKPYSFVVFLKKVKEKLGEV